MEELRPTAELSSAFSKSSVLYRVIAIFGFAILTALSAHVSIPLPNTPVPITLQTLVVLSSGVMLGRDGFLSQLLYVTLGAIGFPMFADGASGYRIVFGATGGYLVGFALASLVTGVWIHSQWSRLSIVQRFLRLTAVSMLIFLPGVFQLKVVTGKSFVEAVALGFTPFVIGDLLKCLLNAFLPNRWVRTKY